MRHYNILPTEEIRVASLSKEALKRLQWIDWYYGHGKNAEATCRHFSLSKSVFYRWKNRFDKRNLQSLEFDSKTRRPKRVREMTTPLWVQQRVVAIRKADPEKSKYEIQEELRREGVKVGQTSIQKVINRHAELQNMQHKKRMKKHRNYAIARVKASVELRERALGSLVQVDTKYLYVLTKKFYLFTAIDCKSRYGFLYCYKTISSASGQDFLRRVREYFPFPIHAVNTDNGSEYLLNFHKELVDWGIPHYFTNPHCPKQNGRVERLHQTAEYEYFNYQTDLLDELDMINERCMAFNTKYNTQRFHRSLGYKTPAECVIILQEKKGGQPFSI
ncbi:MAG: DDE-type integrase/transposase/recombinase [Patescibacteria group bacterium]